MYRLFFSVLVSTVFSLALKAEGPVLIPQINGDFWQISGDPDVAKYTTAKQQPVDFGIWRAAAGTWQLWSCIRGTTVPRKTRLLYRWQGKSLTDKDWTPTGIAMMADPNFGRVSLIGQVYVPGTRSWSMPAEAV